MLRTLKIALLAALIVMSSASAQGQTAQSQALGAGPSVRLTLNEVIAQAQSQSISALTAKYTFLSSYWQFRSFKASRLPSLNLTGNLMNFDRSLRLLQDGRYEIGTALGLFKSVVGLVFVLGSNWVVKVISKDEYGIL
jgi:hypothetical protein